MKHLLPVLIAGLIILVLPTNGLALDTLGTGGLQYGILVWFVICLVPGTGIVLERTDIRMGRRDLWSWCVGGSLVFIIFPAFYLYFADPALFSIRYVIIGGFVTYPYWLNYMFIKVHPSEFYIGLIVTFPYVYIFYRRLVRRARDAGLGKGIVILGLVPILNMVIITILLFKKSKPVKTEIPNTTS
ncbi:hypothetical protein OAJ77_03280 [Rhodospirillales bacterium]|nr:hypothetical protein [Rhodospirillales bacterium]